MRHSKVYNSIMNALNEEISDQTNLVDLMKSLEFSDMDSQKVDVIDRELEKLFKMVHLRNELKDLLSHKEELGEI